MIHQFDELLTKKWFSDSKKNKKAAIKLARAHFSFDWDSKIRRFRSITWSTTGDVDDMGDAKESGILKLDK